MNDEKKFLKSFVKVFDTKFGSGFNISINKEDFNSFGTDEKGNVKLTMWAKKEPGKYGDTHYIVENSYKKNDLSAIPDNGPRTDDLPF